MSPPNEVEATYEAWLMVREEVLSLTATNKRLLEGEVSNGEIDVHLSLWEELRNKFFSALHALE